MKKGKPNQAKEENTSRRSFLKTAAVATGAAAGVMGAPRRDAPFGGRADQVEDADLLGRRDRRLHEVPGLRQEGGGDDRGPAPDRMPACRRHRRDLRDVRRGQGGRLRRLPQLPTPHPGREGPPLHLSLLLPLRDGPSRPVGHLVSVPRRQGTRPRGLRQAKPDVPRADSA